MTRSAGNRLARIGQFAVAHPWRVVGVFVVIAATARFLAALAHPVPWIFGDEFIYIDSARTFAEEGRFAVRDQPFYLSLVTVLLDAPGFLLFGDMESAYVWIKAVNSLVMASAAFPAFGLARMVLSTRMALGFAALVLAWPSNAYVLVVMTEPAFFPALLLGVWAIARAIELPVKNRQFVAMASVLLCLGVRLQALVLLLVIPCALAVVAALHGGSMRERIRRLRVHWPLLVFCVAVPLLGVVVQFVRGDSLADLAGGYSSNDAGRVAFGETLKWASHHIGVVAVAVLVVPAAFALGVFVRLLRRGGTPAQIGVLATIMSLAPLLVFQVAAYASAYSNRVVERNLFAIELLVVLVALVALGGFGHDRVVTAVSAVLLGAAAIAIPFDELLSPLPYSDTFTLLVVDQTSRSTGLAPEWVVGLVVIAALLATAAGIVRPRRATGAILVVTLLPLMAWAGFETQRMLIDYSRDTDAKEHSDPRDWIDRTLGPDARVAVLWPADDTPNWVWQQEIWNRSVRSVAALDGAFEGPGSPLRTLTGQFSRQTGRYVPDRGSTPPAERYFVAPARWELGGEVIGTAQTASIGALNLWRVSEGLRARFLVSGVYADGWTGPRSEIAAYDCRVGGRFSVSVRRGFGRSQELDVRPSGRTPLVVTLDGPAGPRVLRFDALPDPSGVCRLELIPRQTATADEIVGNGDQRELGVHIVSPSFTPTTEGTR